MRLWSFKLKEEKTRSFETKFNKKKKKFYLQATEITILLLGHKVLPLCTFFFNFIFYVFHFLEKVGGEGGEKKRESTVQNTTRLSLISNSLGFCLFNLNFCRSRCSCEALAKLGNLKTKKVKSAMVGWRVDEK